MGFLVIDKTTGQVIGDKIYTSTGRAERVIRETHLLGKENWVVIPMPNARILKEIVNGYNYSLTIEIQDFEFPHWETRETMKNDFNQVDEKLFTFFRKWARTNIEGFYGASVTVADGYNYYNKDGKLLAYVDLSYGKTYYLRDDAFQI